MGAIFTDETAFNATNSFYISAGTDSAPTTAPAKGAITSTHGFYDTALTVGKGTYYIDTPPYECVGTPGVLNTYGGYTTEPAGGVTAAGTTLGANSKGGFGDIGFYPKGTLYFYYEVTNITAAASTAVPASLANPASMTVGANGSCGGGYEAEAWTNLTGSNLQAYAVNDFTSSPVLIAGTSY